MTTKKEITSLKNRLEAVLPNDFGLFDEDGSFRDPSNVFEEAWGKADSIAHRAIEMLEEMNNVS